MGYMAIHAAHAQARQVEQEEEEMTTYSQDDLDNDWEFKIIRSISRTFQDPEVLKQVLEDEARAGWQLVEKFDDQRVRLKRPKSARERDELLPRGVDPYRTQYGWSEGKLVVVVLAAVFACVILGVILVAGLSFLSG